MRIDLENADYTKYNFFLKSAVQDFLLSLSAPAVVAEEQTAIGIIDWFKSKSVAMTPAYAAVDAWFMVAFKHPHDHLFVFTLR